MRRHLHGLVGPSLVAGIVPLFLVGLIDVVFGQTDWLTIPVLLSPLLVALAFVPRLGGRAAWVAVGGVLVGGCPSGSDVRLPSGPLHYDELDVRGAFHHTPAEVDRALALLASGEVDWRAYAGETIGLGELYDALLRPAAGEARKLVVDPRL